MARTLFSMLVALTTLGAAGGTGAAAAQEAASIAPVMRSLESRGVGVKSTISGPWLRRCSFY